MKPISCSFCGKTIKDARMMVAGPNVNICDECVDLCATIIAGKREKATVETADKEPASLIIRSKNGDVEATGLDLYLDGRGPVYRCSNFHMEKGEHARVRVDLPAVELMNVIGWWARVGFSLFDADTRKKAVEEVAK
ncbi:MAG: ClpX C4-type zinc finger protein [Thermoleophilia bacterium]